MHEMVSSVDRPWIKSYPSEVAHDIDVGQFTSLVELMEQAFADHARAVACSFMGVHMRFAQLDAWSRALAVYFQGLGLAPGDRVALMLPNVAQYPVAAAAVLRAGLVVVNVNPLDTAREIAYLLNETGAKAVVVLDAFAATLASCIRATAVQHVVLAAMGDLLGRLRGSAVNYAMRHIKKMVPAFELAGAVRFNDALAHGARGSLRAVSVRADDVAVLQYTGGTTGVPKVATLLHRNLVANVLQAEAWQAPVFNRMTHGEQLSMLVVLPLHHIFAFTTCMMLGLRTGARCVLVANPRDLGAVFGALQKYRVHSLTAVNGVFAGLANHADFNQVDWRSLKLCVGGAMPVQRAVAEQWFAQTGCPICEGYGLSEASPTVSCNPTANTVFNGTIGLPLPSTSMKCIGDDGAEVSVGQPGEIVIKGPQVMAGYWQRPEETVEVMTADGYLRTGDVGVMDERGYFKLVDRKKDMILVGGFNVYPSEIEQVVGRLVGVAVCAAVGVPDDAAGEAIKLVVVKKSSALTEARVRAHCQAQLSSYKQPKWVEFRTELPMTAGGKVLRRALR
jgi:long-chain acyl-CoA synthetase